MDANELQIESRMKLSPLALEDFDFTVNLNSQT